MPRSLAMPDAVDEVIERLQRLAPDARRRWGTMTAEEALCHLADSFRSMMGERPISKAPASAFRRHMTRLIALHAPLPWPRGIRTRPEVDPRRAGTRPAAFDADRQDVIALLKRFASPHAAYGEHPMFGSLSRAEWLIWGYRHMDHHLRQFGV